VGVGRRNKKRQGYTSAETPTKSRPQGGSPRGQAGITHTHKMAGNYRCVCVCWCRRIDQCHRVTLWVMMMMSLLCLHTHNQTNRQRRINFFFSRRNLFVCDTARRCCWPAPRKIKREFSRPSVRPSWRNKLRLMMTRFCGFVSLSGSCP
jgi:hypothetical protein